MVSIKNGLHYTAYMTCKFCGKKSGVAVEILNAMNQMNRYRSCKLHFEYSTNPLDGSSYGCFHKRDTISIMKIPLFRRSPCWRPLSLFTKQTFGWLADLVRRSTSMIDFPLWLSALYITTTCLLGMASNGLVIYFSRKETADLKGDFRFFITMSASIDCFTSIFYLFISLIDGMLASSIVNPNPFSCILLFIFRNINTPMSSFPLSYSRYLSIAKVYKLTAYKDRFPDDKAIFKYSKKVYLRFYILIPLLFSVTYSTFYLMIIRQMPILGILYAISAGICNSMYYIPGQFFIFLITFIPVIYWLVKCYLSFKHHLEENGKDLPKEKIAETKESMKTLVICLLIEFILALPQILAIPGRLWILWVVDSQLKLVRTASYAEILLLYVENVGVLLSFLVPALNAWGILLYCKPYVRSMQTLKAKLRGQTNNTVSPAANN